VARVSAKVCNQFGPLATGDLDRRDRGNQTRNLSAHAFRWRGQCLQHGLFDVLLEDGFKLDPEIQVLGVLK